MKLARVKGEKDSGHSERLLDPQPIIRIYLILNQAVLMLGAKSQQIRCETCGLTYTQFSKMGRFGCSTAIQSLADKLDPILKRVHGNTVHVGKVPKRPGAIQAKA